MTYIKVLLRNVAIGAGVGLPLWLVSLTPYQAFTVGALVSIALGYYPTVQREQKRKGLAIFGWVGIVGFYLFGFGIQAFGYKTDYRLFYVFIAAFLTTLAVAWYIKNVRLKYVLLFAIVLATFVYLGRSFSVCSFIPCQPVRWLEQRAFIRQVAQTYGTEWSIERIRAEPPSGNIYWFTEQPNLQVRVSLLRTVSNADGEGNQIDISSFSYYDVDPRKTLTLDDDFTTISSPTVAQQEDTLESVVISPRDAFNTTRQEGYLFLGKAPESYEVDIDLELEHIPTKFNTQPIWKVSYFNLHENTRLDIWVNATTGYILKKESVEH